MLIAHALLDQARHAGETHRELVGDQLAYRPNATVAQVIDVVHVPASLVQLDEVAQDRDEIVLREDRGARLLLQVQALVDLVAADASEVVALRREEEALQRLFRRLLVRCVAWPQEGIDRVERLALARIGVRAPSLLLALFGGDVLRVGRVLADRVLDQRRLGAARRHEDLHLDEARLPDALDQRLLEGGTRVGDHLARLGVDHVVRQHARLRTLATLDGVEFVAHVDQHVGAEDLHGLHALPGETVQDLLGQLIAFADEDVGGGTFGERAGLLRLELRGIGVGFLADQRDVLGEDRAQHFAGLGASLTLLGEVEVTHGEEEPEDVRVGAVPKGAQQGRGRELLLLVDVDVDHVVDVHGELDPRAAERDDARRDQALPVGVRRLFEHHAWRAMQLAHDDALGPVDDEGAEVGEERQLAEIDFLLDDVARALDAVHVLVDDESQRRLERRRERHVPLDALLDGVLRFAQVVLDELQREVLVDVGDGEEILEDPLEADVLAVMRRGIQLQERFERACLDVEEMGHAHSLVELSKCDLLHQFRHVSPAHRRKLPRPRARLDWHERERGEGRRRNGSSGRYGSAESLSGGWAREGRRTGDGRRETGVLAAEAARVLRGWVTRRPSGAALPSPVPRLPSAPPT